MLTAQIEHAYSDYRTEMGRSSHVFVTVSLLRSYLRLMSFCCNTNDSSPMSELELCFCRAKVEPGANCH